MYDIFCNYVSDVSSINSENELSLYEQFNRIAILRVKRNSREEKTFLDLDTDDCNCKDFFRLLDRSTFLAFNDKNPTALYEVHKVLYNCYNYYFENPISSFSYLQNDSFVFKVRVTIEKAWLSSFYEKFQPIENSSLDIYSFIRKTCKEHPLNEHSLFDYLSDECSFNQLVSYFKSDYELNIRFFDILAFSMIGSPLTSRLEIVKNLWDESGRGNIENTHVNMMRDLLSSFSTDLIEALPTHDSWKKYAGFNLFMLASINRQYYYILIGVMVATECIDPLLYLKVVKGCIRHNIDPFFYRYYSEHSTIDIEHTDGWINNVILPILKDSENPERVLNDIVKGILLRLETCSDYYDSLYEHISRI